MCAFKPFAYCRKMELLIFLSTCMSYAVAKPEEVCLYSAMVIWSIIIISTISISLIILFSINWPCLIIKWVLCIFQSFDKESDYIVTFRSYDSADAHFRYFWVNSANFDHCFIFQELFLPPSTCLRRLISFFVNDNSWWIKMLRLLRIS